MSDPRLLTTLDPARLHLPEKPALEGLEAKWMLRWEQDGVYRFDRTRPRAEVYSIDTPPPTVSGSLHVGHVFSYTHTDLIARFQRMRGKAVFYPMGWDDNGLPTERRVQNYYGVRCDPSLAYDPAFTPPAVPGKPPISVSRPNFIELCNRLTIEDEKAFEQLWKYLGLSVDWSMTYATIGRRAQRISQLAFLRLLRRRLAYQLEAPTLWDVDFRTAVAQAELEDREIAGAYHRIRFLKPGGGDVQIETTRPELIPACVALVAHPGDERYKPLFGTDVITPLFGVRVGEPRPITHQVKFYEKGDRPLEIVTSRQWFIKTMAFRDALMQRARELQWHPPYMQARLENWINGLAGDWCVSRQRFFGVPFPLWYKVRADGSIDYDSRLLPAEERLPVDPSTDVPDGYSEEQRNQ